VPPVCITGDIQKLPLRAAFGAFLAELDRFEAEGVRVALRSLSHDPAFADQSEQLLDLEARLTLLERLAGARALPSGVVSAVDDVVARARRLLGLRQTIGRVTSTIAVGGLGTPPMVVRHRRGTPLGRSGEPDALWIPGARQIEACTGEAAELNALLTALAADLGRP